MVFFKKYIFWIIFIIGVIILCIICVKATEQENYLPLLGKVIVVDPGHPSEIKPSINRTSCSKL